MAKLAFNAAVNRLKNEEKWRIFFTFDDGTMFVSDTMYDTSESAITAMHQWIKDHDGTTRGLQ